MTNNNTVADAFEKLLDNLVRPHAEDKEKLTSAAIALLADFAHEIGHFIGNAPLPFETFGGFVSMVSENLADHLEVCLGHADADEAPDDGDVPENVTRIH